MKKSLQILLGIILILILAYFCFMVASTNIKNDLISKTEEIYGDNNITGVSVKMQGEDLSMGRVLILTGTISSYKKKVDAETLARNIEGVLRVENSIIIDLAINKKLPTPTPTPTPTPIIKPSETIVKPIPTIKPIQTKTIIKSKPTLKPIENTVKSEPVETSINIPTVVTVPVAIKSTVNVPTPIKAIKAPIAIQAEVQEENEKTKLKTKGVE